VWAAITGIGKKTISERLKRGWDPVNAITVKPRRTRDYSNKGN
jgi:hypothetical protein